MLDKLELDEIESNPSDCCICRVGDDEYGYNVGVILQDGEICGGKMGLTYPQSCAHAAELKALTGLPYPTD